MKVQGKKQKNGVINKKMSILFVVTMLAIPVVNWLIFWAAVNVGSIVIAFQDSVTGAFSFVHFERFWKDLTTSGGTLFIAIKNTLLYFATSEFVVFPLTVCVSYFLYKKIFAYKAFRVIFYLPAIISPIVLTYLYKIMVANSGPIGYLLQQIGVALPADGLLGNPATATNTIVVYSMWAGICGKMLLISGSMSRIPVEVLESAKLDGVGVGGELIHMIVPLMWPTLSTLVILSLTGILGASGPVLLFTSNNSYTLQTQTLAYWIFDKVWAKGSMTGGSYGQVAATGLCFTLVLIPIVFGTKRLVEMIPTVEY